MAKSFQFWSKLLIIFIIPPPDVPPRSSWQIERARMVARVYQLKKRKHTVRRLRLLRSIRSLSAFVRWRQKRELDPRP
jgi:hypothetical protein